jgi:hypothetical protein
LFQAWSPQALADFPKNPFLHSHSLFRSLPQEAFPMSRARQYLSTLPDCDDALRRLADVLHVPATCRKRGCRKAERCQGGYGPPCYFDRRKFFADAVLDDMHAYRTDWDARRRSIEAMFRGEVSKTGPGR